MRKCIKLSVSIILLGILALSISLTKVLASTYGGLEYKVLGDRTVEIIGHTDKHLVANIPNEIEDYKVTAIGDNAFNGCTGLEKIIIPNSVKTIGRWAFYGCTRLQQVTIPNSVTTIKDYAFVKCTKLKQVTISNKVTTLGKYAFVGCKGLKEITIPNSVKTIKDYALSDCTGLKQITIPNSVTSIGEFAIGWCTGLKYAIVPNSVKTIGDYAFENCPNLVICLNKGSAIQKYAEENGLKYDFIVRMSKCKAANIANQGYTGKGLKPKLTINDGKTILKEGNDYIVSYKNNKELGTATATIIGRGKYVGTITKKFKIVVGQVKSLETKSQKAKTITVKWKKDVGANGYEIYMSTSKTKGYSKIKTITKNSTISYTATKLKTGQTYYFKVKAYKTVNNGKVYGSYSDIKSVKSK